MSLKTIVSILLKACIFFFLFLFSCTLKAQEKLPPFISKQSAHWADSVISGLSPEQRIAQLFMVAAWSNKDSVHVNEIKQLITTWGIGGLIFFQGGPVRQALLTNQYQSLSKVPLLIGIDGEWGLAMRLDSTIRFPRQMTLSAMPEDTLVYTMGEEIARECKRMGIHTNFSPVADVNNNPQNPIIGSRSFSDDKNTVAKYASVYMKALQDHFILATGKHFPGHGDTDMDSHLSLPTIRNSKTEMDTLELYPFRSLIRQGLGGMMVAHLSVPAFDSIPDHPSTLSKNIVTGLLKEQMGFKGIVFTDALNMKGVSACYKPGVLDKLALLAGNDVMLYSEDVHKAIDEIHLAVENCEIKQEEIDARAKKILMLKYWVGLNYYHSIDTTHLYADLNTSSAQYLRNLLYEKSLTLLRNKDSILPLQHLDSLRIASVVVGDPKNNPFQQQLQMYAPVDCYAIEKDAPVSVFEAVEKFLVNYDVVILSLHNTTMNAQKDFGMTEAELKFMSKVVAQHKTIFVDFGNPYTLSKLEFLKDAAAFVMAYEDMPVSQNLAAQLLFGGIESKGKLPVASNGVFPKNSGLATPPPIRFKYTYPEDVGIKSDALNKIDSIVWKAIRAGAFPGCEVLVAKDQKIIYYKSFGTHTYKDTSRVMNTDLYDVASVTKIVATGLAAMNLVDEKKMDLNQPLSEYLPALLFTNKKNLVIRDVMAHQAGLQPWIPFWKNTLNEQGNLSDKIFVRKENENFSVRVAENIYMRNSYRDSVMQWVYNSPVGDRGKYVYSDLGPILMKSAIEKITSQSLDQYLDQKFYRPLGLNNFSFHPRNKFDLKRIIPTENDTLFRHQLLHADVHDPAAALFGGVSGNAGVFSNANDVAVIMQMCLNRGFYGGKKYISQTTVNEFTKQQFPLNKNRRGLFFDKPEPDPKKASPVCKDASLKTFGHQGFTGTCTWVDPEYNLVYVFLSNRVNPDASNEKLVKMNVRTEIQQVIYDAMRK
ncbi:MAG: serine hydrolase [Bacteroidetes bacterium]|nr:serine hydrolase [Bacteroidota bacterium]